MRVSLLTAEVLLENRLGVLLGLIGGVGVVQVGLVTADNLSFRSHSCSDLLRERCGLLEWYLLFGLILRACGRLGWENGNEE